MIRIEDRGTWRIVTRGAPTPTIAAEYLCPVHGRFTAYVERDANGDAPAVQCCEVAANVNILAEDGSALACITSCGLTSPWCISAPRAKVKIVEVQRGSYQKPEAATWTNTENLGEGQDYDDWVADRDKVWEADREASIKELIDG